jgi:hypothetical protein
MTSISYLRGSSGETDASRFCREKARDCQRAALTTTDAKFRFTFLRLAKLWRDMADARSNKREQAEYENVVIFPQQARSGPRSAERLSTRGARLRQFSREEAPLG